MQTKSHGGCLCGRVKFEVSGAFESFFLCHCSRCRKDTGSAHAANLFSSRTTIAWLSGEDSIKTFRLPDTLHERSFCAECGSALPSVQFEGRLMVFPAGSLDSPVEIAPTAHICLADRANWDDHLEAFPGLQGLPG